jgi:ATP-dependent phosphofructokinase / diphosphate-dependent phosphofructokinase
MMGEVRTIGICTGGGDCPGLNAVIRAAVRCATQKHGWQVVGIRDGFDGLVWPEKAVPLDAQSVSGILPRGGTILGTTNRGNPFEYKLMEDGREVVRDLSQRVLDNARSLALDALIVVGGDGTQKIGLGLHQRGLPVVGVPKTIDNDLCATEVTFGFDTALHTAAEAIDKIHTTAESHHRIMLIEVMGRDVGWIALESAIAGGAHVVLIPEIPFTIANICRFVHRREQLGKRFTIIVVAEGVKLPPELAEKREQERRLSPRAHSVTGVIADAIGGASKRETRVTVLGHIQRGGSPSPFDRILSTRFGVAAVELIAAGGFGRMVCLRGGRIEAVDIAEAVGAMKCVDPHGELVRTARAVGICFGD